MTKLRGHLMPPPGSKQPRRPENDALVVARRETSLDPQARKLREPAMADARR
ncbi:MAG: hypothetical protein IPM70_00625 [Proteobacteria bacterium]|nr:hypothetical protein [Pseudomonadota bacterium]